MDLDDDLRNGTLPLRQKRETRGVTGTPVPIPDQGLFCAYSASSRVDRFSVRGGTGVAFRALAGNKDTRRHSSGAMRRR